MRQVQVSKRHRPGAWRLDPLPLDPRDPDIVRAKELDRRRSTVRPRVSGQRDAGQQASGQRGR
jgi:hypothetical protein